MKSLIKFVTSTWVLHRTRRGPPLDEKCNASARDRLIDMIFERCYTPGTMATLCDCSLAKPRVSASSARSCLASTDLRAPVCSIFTVTSTQRYARRPVTLRIVHQSRRKCSMKVRAAQQSTGEVSAAKQASMELEPFSLLPSS